MKWGLFFVTAVSFKKSPPLGQLPSSSFFGNRAEIWPRVSLNLHEHTSPAHTTLSHIYKRKFKTGEKRHKQHSRNGTNRPTGNGRSAASDFRGGGYIPPEICNSAHARPSNPWEIGWEGRGEGSANKTFSHTKAPEESCFHRCRENGAIEFLDLPSLPHHPISQMAFASQRCTRLKNQGNACMASGEGGKWRYG